MYALHAKPRVEMPTIQKNGIGLYKNILEKFYGEEEKINLQMKEKTKPFTYKNSQRGTKKVHES